MPPSEAIPRRPRRRQTLAELKQLQRQTAGAIMRPLSADFEMQKTWSDGRPAEAVVSKFIKPNDRLSSFERIEIYNKQYWFRLIDVLYDDWPGMRAVIGEPKFSQLTRAYLAEYPSRSFTLRNLGRRLAEFLEKHPEWCGDRPEMAIDMARFEWAQTLAFDEGGLPAIDVDELLGQDPSTLQLGLQPYITLLQMRYPLDDFSIRIRSNALRSEASNAAEMDRTVHAKKKRKIALPRKRTVYVAVHRYRNGLFYKRLEPEGYRLLCALRDGATLETAIADSLPEDADARWGRKLKKWFETWSALGWFCRPKATRRARS